MNWLDDYVNALSLLGAVVILILTVLIAGKYIKQMKDDKADGELAGDSWDGIREFKNNPPIGWSLAFIGTMIWGIWYWFIGYPVNAFSQLGQWNEEVQEANSKFESKWADADKETLKDMGQSIFLVQCAPCHGETAEGIGGKAQNLVEWGHEEGIMNTIAQGSKGSNYPLGEMPAGLLDPDSAKAVSAYIMAEVSERSFTKYPELVETGKALFATCAACHGPDGAGMGGMSPDLTKYDTTKFVSDVLENGKKGHIGTMPSFANRLTNIQQEAVGTYILSIGEKE